MLGFSHKPSSSSVPVCFSPAACLPGGLPPCLFPAPPPPPLRLQLQSEHGLSLTPHSTADTDIQVGFPPLSRSSLSHSVGGESRAAHSIDTSVRGTFCHHPLVFFYISFRTTVTFSVRPYLRRLFLGVLGLGRGGQNTENVLFQLLLKADTQSYKSQVALNVRSDTCPGPVTGMPSPPRNPQASAWPRWCRRLWAAGTEVPIIGSFPESDGVVWSAVFLCLLFTPGD